MNVTPMAPRILIVEDESLLLMLLEELLPVLGYEVAGSVGSVEEAMQRLPELQFEAAVMDVNLGGEQSFPIADALVERGIPLLFTTGYGSAGLPEQYRDYPVLAKPFRKHDLEAALRSLFTVA